MSQNLVASLVLKLEDQLTGGLRRLQDELDNLRGAASKVSLSGLKDADKTVDGLRTKIGQTAEAIYRMQQRAREVGPAFAAMERMAKNALSGIAHATEGVRAKMSAFGEKVGAFGAAASGYSIAKPIEDFAERDTALRQQGIMKGLHGAALDAEMKRVGTLVNADALRNGLDSDSILEARKDLMGRMRADLVDPSLSVHSEAARAYNISADILGPVTGALVSNMKIAPNEKDLGGALAALAQSSQTGPFKMEDFAREMPGLSGVAASLGMTGRGSMNELAAALEISTKTASDPTQAGVNMHDLLAYITSNREDNLTRKKLGIDMPALLLKGEKEGKNPLDVYLSQIEKLTAGKSPVAQAQAISSIVTNQQARNALLALIQNMPEFRERQKALEAVTGDKLAQDHASAMAGAGAQVGKLDENLKQTKLTLGQNLMPVLAPFNAALSFMNEKLTYLNENYPKTTGFVLGAAGAFLALAAVLGALSVVMPALLAGFSLIGAGLGILLSPVQILLTGLRFLVFLIAGLAGVSAGVVVAFGLLAVALGYAALKIYQNWGAVKAFFGTLWEGVKKEFEAFGAWVDKWTGGLASRILGGLKGAISGLKDGVQQQLSIGGGAVHAFENSRIGRAFGLADAPKGGSALAAGAPGASGTVNVHITADPGVKVAAASASPNIKVNALNRGATITRP